MSQATQTKRIRARTVEVLDRDKHGRVRISMIDKKPLKKTKIIGYEPAQPRQYHEFKHPRFGHTIGVWLSPGQIINMYKYEQRRQRKDKRNK